METFAFAMKTYFCVMVFSVLCFGCATRNEEVVLPATGLFGEKEISNHLLAEPIPFPATTPFDSDAKQREAYINGFQQAWNYVAGGIFPHGTIEVSKPAGLEKPWDNGWRDGYKIAGEQWMQELEKLRQRKISQPDFSP